MKANNIQTLEAQILNLDEQYKAGKLAYDAYINQRKRLVRKWKKLAQLTFLQTIKKEGIKITKNGRGWYTYHGKHFTVDIMEEECETRWWEAVIYDDNVDPQVFNHFNEYNRFDTKQECISAVYNFDLNDYKPQ